MAIGRVTWQRVRVPFVRPFPTATGSLTERATVLVAIEADGVTGWGEATPWPAFADGDIDTAAGDVAAWAPRLVGRSIDDARMVLAAAMMTPAARCAFDCALFDLDARARGISVAALLGASRRAVAVNAVIGAVDPATACAMTQTAIDAGITTVKVKVGGASLTDDLARVHAVRDVNPSLAIRLDANGAWGADEAIAALAAFAPLHIAYVEQPVAADDISSLARVRRASAIAIAADESLRDLASARALCGAVDVFVLKLTTLGGIDAARAIANVGIEAGIIPVVTTTIDFGFAVAASLALAATLPPIACGLATAALLRDDLVEGAMNFAGGVMETPCASGLGVTPDCAAIERFASTPVLVA